MPFILTVYTEQAELTAGFETEDEARAMATLLSEHGSVDRMTLNRRHGRRMQLLCEWGEE